MDIKKPKKIYSDDTRVHYKSTTIDPLRTKQEIDGELAFWEIHDSGWHWKPAENEISLFFQIREDVNGSQVINNVKIDCPLIWNKATRKNDFKETPNWAIALREMYWYIKTHLEASYLLGTKRTIEFMPNVVVSLPSGEARMKDFMLVSKEELSTMAKALPQRIIRDEIKK